MRHLTGREPSGAVVQIVRPPATTPPRSNPGHPHCPGQVLPGTGPGTRSGQCGLVWWCEVRGDAPDRLRSGAPARRIPSDGAALAKFWLSYVSVFAQKRAGNLARRVTLRGDVVETLRVECVGR